MTRIYNKSEFINMTPEMLNVWISYHKDKLIGSAIFTANETLCSKIVSWVSAWRGKAKEKDFIPSHVGSIIQSDGNIFVFNMAPPRASMTPLANYLLYTKDDYKLVLRDFELNTIWFSADIAFHIGEFYPYLSAIRSVLTKRDTRFVSHCSELHCRMLQRQDLLKGFNPECTPLELFEELTK